MRVLAVDDNPTYLEKLKDLMLLCKYHVTTTTDPKKALEMLRENFYIFDLVIADADMPDTDVFKLLEIGLDMNLPVIISVPKKIQKLMNVEGLTRADVASHLQIRKDSTNKRKEENHVTLHVPENGKRSKNRRE
ncbi:hypothetical protein EUTSA_v10015618mg [Eutrema salsugineum]|uniref:Response regulatory domain-containing protein n=1 Tax=Eutrema salsugineum TaxID=72664 RepID=V4LFU9_EUTSA|nr:hypothetical protein EUTSA_v10015618mg [Eutrema salsugineum]